MGFKGFSEEDLVYFQDIPRKTGTGHSEEQKKFYNEHKNQIKDLERRFKSLFQDIDLLLKVKNGSEYLFDITQLHQHFGAEYDWMWGAFHTNLRKRQNDIQLFINLGLFSNEDTDEEPTLNVGLAIDALDEEEPYETYKKNLNSLREKLNEVILSSKNEYRFTIEDGPEDNELPGTREENLAYWMKSPRSIWVSFRRDEILDPGFFEKVKSVMLELYPIFHKLVEMEKAKQD